MIRRGYYEIDKYGRPIDDPKEQANILLDSSKAHEIIPNVISWDYDTSAPVSVIDSVWEDSGLEDYMKSLTATHGASLHIWDLLKTPTYNTDLLRERQQAAIALPPDIDDKIKNVATFEKEVAWLFTLPPIKEAYPINILFPTFPILNLINNMPFVLTVFHIYRIIIMPWFNLISPLMTVLSPWFYLRRTLKVNIGLAAYLKLIWRGVMVGLRGGGGRYQMSYITLIVYLALYAYGIMQTFETAALLAKIKRTLAARMAAIRAFVAGAESIIRAVPAKTIQAFSHNYTERSPLIIPPGMSGFYALLTTPTAQGQLLSLMRAVYAIDVCAVIRKFVATKKCCVVAFTAQKGARAPSRMWNMGHIKLTDSQVTNPVSLKHNLVITGPNAAGKTTYVKGICTNYILAQTFGIACARRAEINPVHAIGSFMRISDELGKQSLFEAETKRCAELIKQAEQISSAGQRAIYFLDEPMHSTPPIEGSATSMAVIEHIGKLPGIRLMVTTHYHELINLDKYKEFRNISVEAIENVGAGAGTADAEAIAGGKAAYTFPYKIKMGPSYQCIALELLKENELPDAVIARAIEMKNKLCPIKINLNAC